MRQRVLVVEDDPRLADVLREQLSRRFDVAVAGTGREALDEAAAGPFDLILLDLNLPDMDGLSIAEQLRGTGPEILMLTARGDVKSRVAGLDAGADDYVTKPFHMEELLARVDARLRGRRQPEVVRIGALELSRDTGWCRLDGETLHLSPHEHELLALLAAHRGRIFSKADIVERLYQGEAPASNAVEALVSRVRSKLSEAGTDALIDTVRGVGYVIR